MSRKLVGWIPHIGKSARPHYIAIADAIETDMRAGRLAPNDRLPPQRQLAEQLGLNFTTVARAYVEAQRRGLIESRVGAGSFVRTIVPVAVPRPARPLEIADMTMNLPPEPQDPALIERMRRGLAEVGVDLAGLLRYQGFGGTPADKEAAVVWLARHRVEVTPDRLLICPGAHSALLAVMSTIARAGDTLVSEAITYPGARALGAQLGLNLVGLALDGEGILPDAFEQACRDHAPKALYCNPTLLNPTTATMSLRRRHALIAIARRHGVKIIEDDAYGCIPVSPPPAFAALAPDVTYYISGLAKSLGAGLRVAYLVAPDTRSVWPLASALRAATVMASPLTVALATHWIQEGTAEQMLQAVRIESKARQALVREILPAGCYQTDPEAFHLWVALPPPWSRAGFTAQMRHSGIGVVGSDAFTVAGPPPEAVRVCLGGLADRQAVRQALEFIADALSHPAPAATASVI
ncbi:PLP-dependent aminotransferase family protein [Zavarzinia compransoris]|uniref:GntR family transcriptional regulator n=1 Tax=Zavarzinia compransoris TaxID=1264899 RepID=A0A317E9M1_9PROT|nr:PLP-dependent aminotransferase family protein [Zavarzinia compransoris]PWR22023.1 GntR family transcriptional regulator [Zavarzinia compransoris]TDP47236.1 GntR family transcriptional regulator [Zavarzinia compransoris]